MRDDEGAEYDSLTQGAGAINAAGAVMLAQAINTSAARLERVHRERPDVKLVMISRGEADLNRSTSAGRWRRA